MTTSGAFLEAHSYSGGLRHTAYLAGALRPDWAPPADSVGWRDDFDLDVDDLVVEYHQRAGPAGPVGWLAVYHRSVDARFGDRRNHAGMGAWLHDQRLADPIAVLVALEQLSRALAKNPDPEALAGDVAAFSADPYLPRYLIAADRLPHDWAGVPASASKLVDTTFLIAAASRFDAVVGRVAEEVARCSLDWTGRRITPRTVILITPKAAPPSDRSFVSLGPAGTLLADILERLPVAYDDERRALRTEQASLSQAQAAWEAERHAQNESWEREKSEWQMLDRQPSSLEGIASRLNEVSRQLRSLETALRTPTLQSRPMPATTSQLDTPRVLPRRYREAVQVKDDPLGEWPWAILLVPIVVMIVLGIAIWKFAW